MSTEQEIRAAVDAFYAALNQALNGDPRPMLALWSHGPEATAQHPDGARRLGWDEVRGAWEAWSHAVTGGRIAGEDAVVRLVTPDVAVVTAAERGEGTIGPETVAVGSRATLVLRREGREWKAVHHHVDEVPRIRALVEAAAGVDVSAARIVPPPETVAARFIDELFNQHDVSAVDRHWAPDAVDHDPEPGQGPGLESIKEMLAGYLHAFPDLRMRVDQVVAGRDRVAVRWTATGTFARDLFGAPATGRAATITGVEVFRVVGGRIVERWGSKDDLGLLRQVGLLPEPAAVA